jgi:hypothetical protein
MVESTGCIIQRCSEVLWLQVGIVSKNVLAAHASCIELKNVTHTNPHAADAGLAPALLWVVGDTGQLHANRIGALPPDHPGAG